MDSKQLIGLRIKNARIQSKLTQEALAERIGINSKYLSGIERGKENPTLKTMLDIASALGVSPNEFFTTIEADDSVNRRVLIDELLNKADEEQIRIFHQILSAMIKK